MRTLEASSLAPAPIFMKIGPIIDAIHKHNEQVDTKLLNTG